MTAITSAAATATNLGPQKKHVTLSKLPKVPKSFKCKN